MKTYEVEYQDPEKMHRFINADSIEWDFAGTVRFFRDDECVAVVFGAQSVTHDCVAVEFGAQSLTDKPGKETYTSCDHPQPQQTYEEMWTIRLGVLPEGSPAPEEFRCVGGRLHGHWCFEPPFDYRLERCMINDAVFHVFLYRDLSTLDYKFLELVFDLAFEL